MDNISSREIVTKENINLSNYHSNITITKIGSYMLTGEFENAVLINANGEVTLNLDNVTIKNIANISQNQLNIHLLENTTNILSDGGSSEYDSCLYSIGSPTGGDAGIDTEDGFVIHDGTVNSLRF